MINNINRKVISMEDFLEFDDKKTPRPYIYLFRGMEALILRQVYYEIVNVEQLARCAGSDPVTPEVMKEKGLIKKIGAVKILGAGELKESLNVHAHKFSGSAQAKIEKSGGKAVNL